MDRIGEAADGAGGGPTTYKPTGTLTGRYDP